MLTSRLRQPFPSACRLGCTPETVIFSFFTHLRSSPFLHSSPETASFVFSYILQVYVNMNDISRALRQATASSVSVGPRLAVNGALRFRAATPLSRSYLAARIGARECRRSGRLQREPILELRECGVADLGAGCFATYTYSI